MKEAYKEALKAFKKDEVPIGAVIVKDGKIISKAHNTCQEKKDSTNHAEIIAIKKALKKLNTKYLDECEIYVTIEPCMMCAGAISNSRIKRLYIGGLESKTGMVLSNETYDKLPFWNCEVYHGFMEEECKTLMKRFFENKR